MLQNRGWGRVTFHPLTVGPLGARLRTKGSLTDSLFFLFFKETIKNLIYMQIYIYKKKKSKHLSSTPGCKKQTFSITLVSSRRLEDASQALFGSSPGCFTVQRRFCVSFKRWFNDRPFNLRACVCLCVCVAVQTSI